MNDGNPNRGDDSNMVLHSERPKIENDQTNVDVYNNVIHRETYTKKKKNNTIIIISQRFFVIKYTYKTVKFDHCRAEFDITIN